MFSPSDCAHILQGLPNIRCKCFSLCCESYMIIAMLNNEKKCWTTVKTEFFCNCILLRSLPRGEFLCEALHHWSATAKSEKPLVTTLKSAQLHQSLSFSAAVEGEKLLGEWILLLPLNLTGFCFWYKRNIYSSDEIGVWGVSRYWRNAFHVPGQHSCKKRKN